MTIIVDSGSTKADWCLVNNNRVVASFATQGITPVHQSEQSIRDIIHSELLADGTFVSSLQPATESVIEGFFYCSGCIPEKALWLKSVLDEVFSCYGISFCVYNDLLGAARALCGHDPGIACILGTGANSCLYDGNDIVANTPPLGYILGDEGSGAYLGKRFLNGIFKGWLDKELLEGYIEWSGLKYSDIISRVYSLPMPNKYLASIVPFIKLHVDEYPDLENMVVESFRDFLRLNLSQYKRKDLSVNFTGGVANVFSKQLLKAIDIEHYKLGVIVAKPIFNLIKFHSSFI